MNAERFPLEGVPAPLPRGASDLAPARDVEATRAGYVATASEPWLSLQDWSAFRPGRIVRVTYSTNLFDDPVRPIIRFWRDGKSSEDHLMPAPYEGAGVWIGRVPRTCSGVWISPTSRLGPFDFRLRSVEKPPLAFMLNAAMRAPRRMFYSAGAWLVGLDEHAAFNLRRVFGRQPLSSFRAWAEQRRPIEPSAPRTDWSRGPTITLLVRLGDAKPLDAEATRRSIRDQTYPNWRVVLLRRPGGDDGLGALLETWLQDSRFACFESANDAEVAPEFNLGDGLLGVLRAGDELRPHALACFAEHFARHPEQTIVYADDISFGAQGRETPRLKPDWSPVLNGDNPYVGRAAIIRQRALGWRFDPADSQNEPFAEPLARAGRGEVGHVRRALLRFPEATGEPFGRPMRVKTVPAPNARVSIIVPTRDRADLLEPCLRSVLDLTSYRNFDVVVVDNGSVEPATHRLFGALAARGENVRVASCPGAFNFSALANFGVEQARGEFVVFLNNDTVAVTPDWIERMLSFARRPDVGAVGARLLFDNGRVQHVGIVLGLGGEAGHFGANAASAEPGWLGGNKLSREVSAVTGACLMVEKAKFAAVGGFDADHLPVEYSDIDLCLRLGEHGWATICNNEVEFIHRQSASRGSGVFRYPEQRAYYCERWRSAIRDDPFFNPALSLSSKSPRLG